MRRLAVPGGWYADVAGTDDYAVLMTDSFIQTARGTVPLPGGENVLYLRAYGTQLCGVGGGSDLAWEWDGTRWASFGLAHGVSACIFDQSGTMRIATPAQGSQGYRYCAADGSLATGDDTYNAATPFAVAHGVKDLWEWTQYGDLTIGQNSTDECVIAGPAGRRVLERGQCRFIRFIRNGDALAVAMWKPLENSAVLHWLTHVEVATLPLETDIPIDPPIDPDPEVPVKLPDDVYATLVALRPTYPTPLAGHGATLLNEVAWTHRAQGYGLERKDGGANCAQPTTQTPCGCDILRTSTLGWDVLQDSEGAGNPVQSDSGPADPARFVAPVQPSGVIVDPDPDPDPELEQRVTALEAKVAAQQVQLHEQKSLLNAQATALDLLEDRVKTLEDAPPPSGTIEFPMDVILTAQGSFTGTLNQR